MSPRYSSSLNSFRSAAAAMGRRGISIALGVAAAAAVTVSATGAAQAAPACPNPASRIATSAFLQALRDSCSQAQFDAMFASAPAGAVPVNLVMNGQLRPMGAPNPAASAAAGALWQGKHFYNGWLNNRVLGGEALFAGARLGRSVIDGKPVVRVDYARSGLGFAHDELRRLPNGIYLGYGFLNDTPQVNFWVWR